MDHSKHIHTGDDLMPGDDLTVREFCAAARICKATAYKFISTGEIRSYRLRGKRLIPRAEAVNLRRRLLAEAERENAA